MINVRPSRDNGPLMTTYTPPRPGVAFVEHGRGCAAMSNVIQRACEVIAASDGSAGRA